MKLELVPVIDVSPSQLSPDRLAPGAGARRGCWHEYGSLCIADAGLAHAQLGDEWLVRLADVAADDACLRTVFTVMSGLGAVSLRDELDRLGPLEGGLAFVIDGEVVLIPQCCTSLDSRADWRQAIAGAGADWRPVVVGHPFCLVRSCVDDIEISQPCERGEPEVALRVPRARLLAELDAAEAAVDAALPRVSSVVRALTKLPASAVAATLLGFPEQTVRITGWRKGVHTIALIKLVRDEQGVGLREALAAVNRVLAGEVVDVPVRDSTRARDVLARMRELRALAHIVSSSE